ncbi:CoA transferase [Nocardioides carbamazepini]|uniref:CaiB/BaiF CoA transferase family protein n=1 Tax=Nocardioides carbamazepini TaxID=2854259 RepID=UPI002149EC02|nr:CoA transferase [Nocardioides carbamazepini]MCR1785829.1 CoA transferase [Nocardioides carbamazepini]
MSQAPLAGIRIVDLTRLIAGPAAGDLLAAMGADVVKVEDAAGDAMRNARSRRVEHGLTAPSFAAYNVMKRSVVLDLKTPEGHARALDLCAEADVVVSAFRPGVMDRLGLGVERLREVNPRVVVARLSAFGTGAEADRGGVDIVLQAETGLMAVTGGADQPPTKVGLPIVDAASAYVLALGIVAALLGRERGGGAEQVDVSMRDVGLHLQAQPLAEFLESGQEPERVGNAAPYAAPADVFRAADGDLVLSAHLPTHWTRLTELLGHPEWAGDERFATVGARVAHREELTAAIESVLGTRTVAQWLGVFAEAGLTAGRIATYADAVAAAPDDSFVGGSDHDGSALRLVRTPLRFGGWDERILPRRVPAVGEHTATVVPRPGEPAA